MRLGLKLNVIYLLYVCALIMVSLWPGNGDSLGPFDKLGHFVAYGGMALLSLLAFKSGISRTFALFFALALGFVLEWGQSFIPNRDMSLLDGLSNTMGITAGALVFWLREQKIVRFVDRILGD